MDFTIEFTSGGNHGHQLKDALGAMAIGHLFNMNYVHTPYEYLDFFGIGYNYPVVEKSERTSRYKQIVRVEGPLWCGVEDYDEMVAYFQKKLPKRDDTTLVIIENALRIHPFQTIPWFQQGRLEYDIYSTMQKELSENFLEKHSITPKAPEFPIQVAMHINRGMDYDREKFPQHFTSPYAVRYMFDMDYYENILIHLEKAYGVGNVEIKIYTELSNSEDILDRFEGRPHTEVMIGSNREQKNYDLVHNIYQAFVEADILVCSNSSFSVMCSYFRKSRTTIYHPHLQLRHLPKPNYIPTTEEGSIDIELLPKVLDTIIQG
ncbi:hypothetical protein [Pseudotenacibaculum haliotis]|uniref:Glycosyltransferase family 9 protein n=1 Tax=Pseudotenacibaculum haliotis TaxID=1862138 RepID=A0ABW5LSJ7_9FLAO